MKNKMIENIFEKSLEIICPLYKADLIVEAYIIGSSVEGKATDESDIDVMLINPEFNSKDMFLCDKCFKNEKTEKLLRPIVEILKSKNVKWTEKKREGDGFRIPYQVYKGKMFHIMYDTNLNSVKGTGKPYIEISRDICNNAYHSKGEKSDHENK